MKSGRLIQSVNPVFALTLTLKLREGLRYRWHTGIAYLLSDDDPCERQRWLATQLPSSAGNERAVRLFGTQLLSIRIDLGD